MLVEFINEKNVVRTKKWELNHFYHFYQFSLFLTLFQLY